MEVPIPTQIGQQAENCRESVRARQKNNKAEITKLGVRMAAAASSFTLRDMSSGGERFQGKEES